MTLNEILSEKPDLQEEPQEFFRWYEKLKKFDDVISKDYKAALLSATRSAQSWHQFQRNNKSFVSKPTLW